MNARRLRITEREAKVKHLKCCLKAFIRLVDTAPVLFVIFSIQMERRHKSMRVVSKFTADVADLLFGFSWPDVKATGDYYGCRTRLPNFYRAMHFSAKRGIAIACRLSVCDVGEL